MGVGEAGEAESKGCVVWYKGRVEAQGEERGAWKERSVEEEC